MWICYFYKCIQYIDKQGIAYIKCFSRTYFQFPFGFYERENVNVKLVPMIPCAYMYVSTPNTRIIYNTYSWKAVHFSSIPITLHLHLVLNYYSVHVYKAHLSSHLHQRYHYSGSSLNIREAWNWCIARCCSFFVSCHVGPCCAIWEPHSVWHQLSHWDLFSRICTITMVWLLSLWHCG